MAIDVTTQQHGDGPILYAQLRKINQDQAKEIERLRAENADLQKDRERLEWLAERSDCAFIWMQPGDSFGANFEYTVCCDTGDPGEDYEERSQYHDNWRDAIDEAMGDGRNTQNAG